MSARIIIADVLAGLATLKDQSVQTVVTSPPYWGLRDYGVPGQLGLEANPDDYLEKMVEVFREVRRVLKLRGTLWLNMGDCYATGAGRVGDAPGGGEQGARWRGEITRKRDSFRRDHAAAARLTGAVGPGTQPNRMPLPGLKPKDLVGMPWRLAFALQADGWWLRSDIVWSKPNPMPESVTDRPTKAHEYLFLMSRAARYYYNADAIREPVAEATWNRIQQAGFDEQTGGPKDGLNPNRSQRRALVNLKGRLMCPQLEDGGFRGGSRSGVSAPDYDDRKWADRSDGRSRPPMTMTDREYHPLGRNKRSVWEIATAPFPEAHFATFPVTLVEPCILAGSRPGDTVLDPFAGAGTTLLVADRLARDAIGIELNPDYAALAERRIHDDAPLLASVQVVPNG
jgi:DNA modification methylase